MLRIAWILCLDRYDIRINLNFEDARMITDRGAQFGIARSNSAPSSTKLGSALTQATMSVTPTNVETTFMCDNQAKVA